MAQIIFENVSLSFSNSIIIEKFNLAIEEGEIVTFFGPSGCGKSSIMKMILGINSPTKGNVKIGNNSARAYKEPISYVPQENELLPWLSVKKNVEMWSNNVVDRISTDTVLDLVDLQNHSGKLPAMLSGGMARRTALARGLATKSDIMCFDEAMVGIEKTMRHKLLLNLRSYIKQNNSTAIFISHDFEETIFLSDRIIIFTPPPTEIAKEINVKALSNDATRDASFTNSQFFKHIYEQMLTL